LDCHYEIAYVVLKPISLDVVGIQVQMLAPQTQRVGM
jgi:hypothetical protein